MKRKIMMLAAMLVCLVHEGPAQFLSTYDPATQGVNGGLMLTFKGTTLGTATLTSNTFSLGDFDGLSFVAYPVQVVRYLNVHLAADTLASHSIYLDGSMDGTNFLPVDTIATTDTTRGARTYSTIDFNEKKYLFYHLRSKGGRQTWGRTSRYTSI